jgi:hypothetical protein
MPSLNDHYSGPITDESMLQALVTQDTNTITFTIPSTINATFTHAVSYNGVSYQTTSTQLPQSRVSLYYSDPNGQAPNSIRMELIVKMCGPQTGELLATSMAQRELEPLQMSSLE